MIELSNGVEISEDTVVSALKKAGISVEPKHVFRAGDVVKTNWELDSKRIIIHVYGGNLIAVDIHGSQHGSDADSDGKFRGCHYEYVGKLSDMI